MISMIEDSVNRANQMIEEFRLRTRDSPVMLVKTDLSKLLDRTVKEISLSCNVELVNNTSEICEVVLDPAKIRRVLDNMIKNAVDAMPQGGTLTVETGREGGYIYITVSDTGVGIPEEKLSTLFKPFQTTKSKGLGLGLSYCKRAVEALGGRIQVESLVGKGTTFTIMIPDNLEEPESVPSINY